MALQAAPVRAGTCDLVEGTMRIAAKVESADRLLLDDGAEAILIGALPPAAVSGPSPAAEASRLALEGLAGGEPVQMATSGRKFDRYGRQLVHAFIQRGSDRLWVQGELVERGLARAYALPGNAACLDELLMRERRARAAQAGHWASGVFHDVQADDLRTLTSYRDTFQTIEGRVARISRLRGQTVIDFGPQGQDAFSAVLEAPAARGARKARTDDRALTGLGLEGRRVRVRGWIDVQRRRPSVTLADAGMIEVLDDAAAVEPPRPDANGGPSNGQAAPIPAAAR